MQQESPEHDVCEEAGLHVISTPADTLAVDREVFGDPEDWIRQTAPLSGPKLLVKAPRCMTHSHRLQSITIAE